MEILIGTASSGISYQLRDIYIPVDLPCEIIVFRTLSGNSGETFDYLLTDIHSIFFFRD
jgi:hypothetical protein